MPFWKGDQPSRPVDFGRRIGALMRELSELPRAVALQTLTSVHRLDERAAQNLLQYLDDQTAATRALPTDRRILIERCRDEIGDWRVCVLSPLGGQVHAPLAMAAAARVKRECGFDVETLWTNDGFVMRFPEADDPPAVEQFWPSAAEVERLVVDQLGATALFAAKFREVASRSLLIPKRRPGARSALWQIRRRAADLLEVAARYPSFPMLLETYRECLRDVFDMPSVVSVLSQVERRELRLETIDSTTPSPFASHLLFGWVAQFLYEGDAPLAERRAQALAIDTGQLRELLGDVELRELLDAESIAEVEAELQHLGERGKARSADAMHDLLLRLGDLTRAELQHRSSVESFETALRELIEARRVVEVRMHVEERLLPVEYAARYRDGLGVMLPRGLPESLLAVAPGALSELVVRYARTHGPFTVEDLIRRHGLTRQQWVATLGQLSQAGRILEGAFIPGGSRQEWCDPGVLKSLRHRSLAKLRGEIEAVEPLAFARFLTRWSGAVRRRRGVEALLDAVERLQGAPLAASILETEILPARIDGYSPNDLDLLTASGEVVWTGVEPLGEHDGRVSLYLTDHLPRLWRPPEGFDQTFSSLEEQVVRLLRERGASFFINLQSELKVLSSELVDVLWSLVWKGVVANDTFSALRAHVKSTKLKNSERAKAFRSRRMIPPSAEGRWWLVASRAFPAPTATEWTAAYAQQLLSRHGVLTREMLANEGHGGGFSGIYPVLRALEESGRVRRGFFVSSLAATQFALPGALDLLRRARESTDAVEIVSLSATDPANPYGLALAWPQPDPTVTFTRGVGAQVVLGNGALLAYLSRGGRQVWLFLPEDPLEQMQVSSPLAQALVQRMRAQAQRKGGLVLSEINGQSATAHPFSELLVDAGCLKTPSGLFVTRLAFGTTSRAEPVTALDDEEGEEVNA